METRRSLDDFFIVIPVKKLGWQGRGAGTTGLRNDIQKCLREHTEGVGEYQFEKSRKIISERGTAETKAVAALSVRREWRVDAYPPVGREQILRLGVIRSEEDSAHL